ncbi:hypothetical protein B7494_g2892 [Chlorociboria aeruginascens]|nr:hypothetical protein B7494_g2892 [Chlorociboria aeruginascens]
MLAIQAPKQQQEKCTPNILPCRIHHTGPINVSKRHWDPVDSADQRYKIAYFRGRKLYGVTLGLPQGYRGVVAAAGDQVLASKTEDGKKDERMDGEAGDDGDGDGDGDEDEGEAEAKVLEEVAGFEQVVVWGHESIADASDPYVRGMEEWIAWSACRVRKGEADEM